MNTERITAYQLVPGDEIVVAEEVRYIVENLHRLLAWDEVRVDVRERQLDGSFPRNITASPRIAGDSRVVIVQRTERPPTREEVLAYQTELGANLSEQVRVSRHIADLRRRAGELRELIRAGWAARPYDPNEEADFNAAEAEKDRRYEARWSEGGNLTPEDLPTLTRSVQTIIFPHD